jgi:vancomycin resistance protein YoaR
MVNLKFGKVKKQKIFLIFASFFVFFLVVFSAFNLFFFGKIFPGLYIADLSVGGKEPAEVMAELQNTFSSPKNILLVSKDQNFEISPTEIGFAYDFSGTAQAAYEFARTGNIFYDFYRRFTLLFKKTEIGLRFKVNEDKLQQTLGIIAGQVETKPVYPSIKLVKKQVEVENGSVGYEVDQKSLRAEIGRALALNEDRVDIPFKKIDPTINDEQVKRVQERAEKLLPKTIDLKYELEIFTYKGEDLFKFLNPKDEYQDEEISNLVKTIAKQLNSTPQNPIFVFEGGKVGEFAPAKDGVAVKEDLLKEMFVGNLRTLEQSEEKTATIDIPVDLTPPKIQTGDVNNLGIKELLGRGSSHFYHSIPNRIHNIGLASSKFKGVLLAPGETLSFNKVVGDVSGLTGFKQAYIIKEGKTILGDGGGVCQVSTTLFRAALQAGLPIIQRQAHAYRVSYYEQDSPPGFDATVYDPTADLKIKNDTPAHILIQPTFDSKKMILIFDIYGTSDGRIASTTKPVITDQVAPPEDLYQDDPSLPAGTIKQIDWKAWGAKVTFNYLVQRTGEVIYKKTFVSNYQPWQAVYLRGTGATQ